VYHIAIGCDPSHIRDWRHALETSCGLSRHATQHYPKPRIALETQCSDRDGAGNNIDGLSPLFCVALVSIHAATQIEQTSMAKPALRQFPNRQPGNWRKAASMIEALIQCSCNIGGSRDEQAKDDMVNPISIAS
jgi:hypothetical protein